jgi:hypothetical protein
MTSSSIDSEEDGDGWASADFSGLDDPGALRQLLGNSDYLLEVLGPNNESCDPSQECFMCDRELRGMRRGYSHATTHGAIATPTGANLGAREEALEEER